ncbi:MAG TPA: hypothetical protein VHO25_22250 [Polyangiaceae bacterium]|nr:hypothetical protein [Polyangiaceae bacterium]
MRSLASAIRAVPNEPTRRRSTETDDALHELVLARRAMSNARKRYALAREHVLDIGSKIDARRTSRRGAR